MRKGNTGWLCPLAAAGSPAAVVPVAPTVIAVDVEGGSGAASTPEPTPGPTPEPAPEAPAALVMPAAAAPAAPPTTPGPA
eukprot:12886755-Prorocentrum_lima.AAC.1